MSALSSELRSQPTFGSAKRENLNRNLSLAISIFEAWTGIHCNAEFKMEIDNQADGTNAKKFREYAAECRRMAHTASEEDRAALIQIAKAWIACAEESERDAKGRGKSARSLK